MRPSTVTDAQWETGVLQRGAVVVLVFLAPTNRACRGVAEMLSEVVDDLGARVRLMTIDVDANHAVPRRYDVSSLPTFLVFRGGELVGRLVGARSRDGLLRDLSPYLP